MLSPKKMIPSLAAAVLPLAGTACGDGGGAESNLSNAFNAFCMTVAGCYPGYDINECLAYEEYYADYAGNYGAACINAVASYFQCLSELTCEDYMDENSPAWQACETQFDSVFSSVCSN